MNARTRPQCRHFFFARVSFVLVLVDVDIHNVNMYFWANVYLNYNHIYVYIGANKNIWYNKTLVWLDVQKMKQNYTVHKRSAVL